MNNSNITPDAGSQSKPTDDKTWAVLLVVFGLAGIGGPIIALILFFIIANLT